MTGLNRPRRARYEPRAVWLVLIFLGSVAMATAQDMKPYPAAEPGYTRYVFRVPETDNDDDHKVEILVGKKMLVDCNTTRFAGQLESQTVEGWGYSYFKLPAISGPLTTLMACPEGEEQMRFVPVHGEGYMQRYNHKLPVVVYVPDGFEVRYRIWSAEPEFGQAIIE